MPQRQKLFGLSTQMAGYVRFCLTNGLSCQLRVDRMIKCDAESALGYPSNVTGDTTNIAEFDLNIVAPFGEYWCFCHQTACRQIANPHFAAVVSVNEAKRCCQKQTVTVELALRVIHRLTVHFQTIVECFFHKLPAVDKCKSMCRNARNRAEKVQIWLMSGFIFGQDKCSIDRFRARVSPLSQRKC